MILVSGSMLVPFYRRLSSLEVSCAIALAGRLLDGKLWDGESPIRFDDVYAVAKKIKHLTDKDFLLFSLDEFVQTDVNQETT